MSSQVTSWVLNHSDERLGRRLVLLVLADHANHDGTGAWPSVETIARESRLSERQARNCLRGLEDADSIVAVGKSHSGTINYTVLMRGGSIRPPEVSDIQGGRIASTAVSKIAPEPSLEQPPIRQPSTALGKVDRQIVKPEHEQLARLVLSEWNRQTSQSLGSRDWLAKIVMRIREHPDYGIEEHAHVIVAALAAPWWTGPPTPSVVYGSGAQFERSIVTATSRHTAVEKRRYGIGMTSEEILRSTQGET